MSPSPPSAAPQPATGLLPAAELAYWTERYAQGGDLEQGLAGATYVLFRVGGERFAVALQDLDEVASIATGIALPHLSPLVLGLANCRGELLPLLDTAALLGVSTGYRLGLANRTLVVRDQRGRRAGLPVDAVESVEVLDPAIFLAQRGAPSTAPVRRVGLAEHAGKSLALLDVTALREGNFSHF